MNVVLTDLTLFVPWGSFLPYLQNCTSNKHVWYFISKILTNYFDISNSNLALGLMILELKRNKCEIFLIKTLLISFFDWLCRENPNKYCIVSETTSNLHYYLQIWHTNSCHIFIRARGFDGHIYPMRKYEKFTQFDTVIRLILKLQDFLGYWDIDFFRSAQVTWATSLPKIL